MASGNNSEGVRSTKRLRGTPHARGLCFCWSPPGELFVWHALLRGSFWPGARRAFRFSMGRSPAMSELQPGYRSR